MSLLSDLPAGLSGLEQLQALLAEGRQPPIHMTLGIALTGIEAGLATIEATPGEGHLNPGGAVHGGYIATILDSACGCATLSALPPDTAFTTLEIKVAYHRALTADTGKVRAEGRLLSIGRRVAFAEAKLHDPDGRLLASATSTLIILPR